MPKRMMNRISYYNMILQRPDAKAILKGSQRYPEICGTVLFSQTEKGVLIAAEICGLPVACGVCHQQIFGFHIHSGGRCEGNMDDLFSDAQSHYDPNGCDHPFHAGDLPPLFGNCGYAFSMFITNRFMLSDVIGRTVILHDHADDFTSQPSGNAGEKIGCGVILPCSGSNKKCC